MADVIINKRINVSISEHIIPPVVPLMQYDAGFRTVTCVPYIDGVQYEVPSALTAILTGTRNDETYFEFDSQTAPDSVAVSDGTVLITVNETMSAAPGRCCCNVRLVDGDGNVIGAFPFILSVHKAAVQNDTVSTGSYSSLVESMLTYATYVTDVYVDDDGYMNIVIGDGVNIVFTWDEDGNVIATY